MSCLTDRGWPKCVRCHIYIGHFQKKSPVISGSFEERLLQLKATYASLPPCTYYMLPCNWWLVFGKETCEIKNSMVFRHHASSCWRLACVPNVSELFVFEKIQCGFFRFACMYMCMGMSTFTDARIHACMYALIQFIWNLRIYLLFRPSGWVPHKTETTVCLCVYVCVCTTVTV